MVSHKIISKFLIIGMLVFLLLNTSSLGGYQVKLSDGRQEPIPSVFGQIGENQWYVTGVTISFEFDPQRVVQIQYKLGEIWYIYDDPFNVVNDGVYMIPWFWVDLFNNSNYGGPIEFKIDKTAPTIELTKKITGKEEIIFTADAVDAVSAIEKVEFYLDDVLILTDTEEPYQYTWEGHITQVVYAKTYNFAGFDAISNNLTTEPRIRFRNHNLMHIIFVLIQKTFFRFN